MPPIPPGGRLVNAFDLMRLHRFGDLDDAAPDGARGNRLPSWAAMCDLAKQDEAVAELMARERGASAVVDFQGVVDGQNAVELGRCAGEQLSLETVRVALKAIGTQVRRNLVTNKAEITGMPAAYSQEDAVNNLPTVLWDLLRGVGVKGVSPAAVRACLGAIADENRYNPVLDMLHTTAWDRVSRFPMLLDILNIDSGSFYALLVRKWLIQCVALIHNTAIHQEAAEGVLVIQGPQGIGKTTLFRKLAVKSEWLSEGVTLDMKNKDDIIRATSVWITELGELDDTLKKEQASLKSFITQKVDKIRAPYAAEPTDRPRRTSFGATVNRAQFLKDDTGDRRFFVIPVKEIKTAELLALQPDWVIQLWAEVYIWWWREPQGFRLSGVEKEHLNTLNQQHREISSVEEGIRLALNWDLPLDQWGRFTSGDIKRQLFSSDFRTTAEQIGKALARLERDDDRIKRTISRGVKHYRLPLKNVLVSSGG